jgi:plasmid maintenance system antidote protein VapI
LPAPNADACRQGTPVDTLPECHFCRADIAPGTSGDDKPAADPAWLRHLYLCQEFSTYEIARRTGLDRQRVTRMLRKSGVPLRARGAGRLRALRRTGDPPDLPQLMRDLYEDAKLSSRQVAAILGMPERTVRERLRRYGITARTRGRCNREDRKTVPAEVLEALYSELGMTAAEVGRRLGISGNNVLRDAHALGIPVRSGGAVPLPGPGEIELVAALYADPLIAAVLTAHGIPRVPPGGSIASRFPQARSADNPAGQGPVLGVRHGDEPYRAAHRASGGEHPRVHAARGYPASASRRENAVPEALAGRAGRRPRSRSSRRLPEEAFQDASRAERAAPTERGDAQWRHRMRLGRHPQG